MKKIIFSILSFIILIFIFIFFGGFDKKDFQQIKQNNIKSIFLFSSEKFLEKNFGENLKEKKGISLILKEEKYNFDGNIFVFDGKLGKEIYLNHNFCYEKICDYESILLKKVYFDGQKTYFLKDSKITKKEKNKKYLYDFWSLYLSGKIEFNQKIYFYSYENSFLKNYYFVLGKIFSLSVFDICFFVFLGIFYGIICFYSGKIYEKYGFLKLYIFLIFLIFLFGVLQIILSKNYILYDEYYSFVMIKQSFLDIILATSGDVHPPLYYFYLKINNLIFGDNILVLKILNICLIFPLFFVIYKIFKLIFGENYEKKLLFITIFLGLNTYFIMFIGIIRMYLFGIVLFMCSCYFLLKYLIDFLEKKQKNIDLIYYFIFSFLCLYTHNYLLFFIFSTGLFALFFIFYNNYFGLIKKFIFGYFSILLGFLPWFFVILKQSSEVNNNYWIKDFSFYDLGGLFLNYIFYLNNSFNFSFSNNILLFIELICFLYLFYIFINNKSNLYFKILVLIIILIPIFFGVLYSIFIKSIFQERYFIFFIIFFAFFVVGFLEAKKLKILFLFMFLVCVENLGILYLDNEKMYQKIDNFIINLTIKNDIDIILNNSSQTLFVVDYIKNQNKIKCDNLIFVSNKQNLENNAYNGKSLFYKFGQINEKNIDNLKGKKVLFFGYGAENIINIDKKFILKNGLNYKIPYIIFKF